MIDPAKGNNEEKIIYLAVQRALPDWKTIVTKIQQDIEEPLQTRALHAVSVFRKILGEKFFNRNIEGHPLQRKCGNIVPWQLYQLCQWADVLHQLQHSQEDINYLSSLLVNRKKCEQEGIHFLNIASSLLQNGFNLKFIRGRQDQRLPDISVSDVISGEIFFIEVSHLQKSDQFQSDEKNFNEISNACLRYAFNLLTSVHILRSLDANELKLAISCLQETAASSYKDNKLHVSRLDFIDIAFAPISEEAAFSNWLQLTGREKGIRGIEVKADETVRLMDRILKKVKQIPSGESGIIYFGVQFIYFLIMDHGRLVAVLKEIMKPFSRLKGIVLSCDVIDPDTQELKEFEGQEDVYSIRSNYGHTLYTLYCVNDHYKGSVSQNVFVRFRKSLITSDGF